MKGTDYFKAISEDINFFAKQNEKLLRYLISQTKIIETYKNILTT